MPDRFPPLLPKPAEAVAIPGRQGVTPTAPRAMLADLAGRLRPDAARPWPPRREPLAPKPPAVAKEPSSPLIADRPLNADQVRFLAELPPDLRALLDGDTPRSRASLLKRFEMGGEYGLVSRDAVSLLENRRRFLASPVASPLSSCQDARSLMEAVASGNPLAPVHLAQRLVMDFGGDYKSRRAFEKVGKELLLGVRGMDEVWHAYSRALGPTAKNPGAVFNTELRQAIANSRFKPMTIQGRQPV